MAYNLESKYTVLALNILFSGCLKNTSGKNTISRKFIILCLSWGNKHWSKAQIIKQSVGRKSATSFWKICYNKPLEERPWWFKFFIFSCQHSSITCFILQAPISHFILHYFLKNCLFLFVFPKSLEEMLKYLSNTPGGWGDKNIMFLLSSVLEDYTLFSFSVHTELT